jgi:hypothetical protein
MVYFYLIISMAISEKKLIIKIEITAIVKIVKAAKGKMGVYPFFLVESCC